MQNNFEQAKLESPKRKFILVLITLLVFFLGFGVTYAYFSYRESNDKRIIYKSFEKTLALKTVEVIGSIDQKIELDKSINRDKYEVFRSKFDGRINERSFVYSSSFDYTMDLNDPKNKIIGSTQESIYNGDPSTLSKSDGRSFGKDKAYVSYANVPGRNNKLYLDRIKGVWFTFSNNSDSEDSFNLFYDFDFSNLKNDIFDLFEDTKKYPDENIEGSLSYHYAILINKNKVKEEFEKYNMMMLSKAKYLDESIIQNTVKYFNDQLDLLKPIIVEIWIEKNSLYINKIKTSIGFNVDDLQGGFDMSVMLKKYNQPVFVEEPKDSVDFQQLYPILSGNPLQSVNSEINIKNNLNDQNRISSIKQIQTALELFFTDNYKYPIANNLKLGGGGATCLDAKGFDFSCISPYMGLIPKEPTEGKFFIYNSKDGKQYTIDFNLDEGAEGFIAGPIQASESGLKQ